MAKKNITHKVIGIGAGLALGTFSLVSNAQDYNKIQKGVNTREVLGETPTQSHVIFHYNMSKDLQKAIKSSKKPHLYLTGDKNSYMIVDPDTSGFKIYYSKKNFDENGNGKVPFVVNIKGDEHLNPCDENGLGSKTNYLVSFYDLPSRGVSEKSAEPAKEPSKEPTQNISQTIINKDSHDVYNYFYGDTTKVKEAQQKLSPLELRLLIEENKTMNPIENPFWGTSAAVQLGKGAVWLGPYVTTGFGSETSSSSTPIYHETLLNQAFQLFTVTEGVRNEYANITYPIEFGGLLSVGSKDGRVRVNLGAGVVNEKTSTSDAVETGYDWMTQNGVVVGEKKPYATVLKKGSENNKYIPTQKVGVDVHPFKKSGFYLGGEAQHRGKINSKMDKINYNIKAGWRFGGRKK
ncbi:MAG TPA: hypothetical protein PK357_02970 [Candidatus Pacearchaeota archaeon]|nr:hypothetical protein [Candidatus Pacearchaeota archaeon]